jgi:hypothetical protein
MEIGSPVKPEVDGAFNAPSFTDAYGRNMI